MTAGPLTKDEARRIAANIAKCYFDIVSDVRFWGKADIDWTCSDVRF